MGNEKFFCKKCKKELIGRQRFFCSRKCGANFRSQIYKRKGWADLLLNYFNKECELCKSKKNLHLHHIQLLSENGKNELSNLMCVCKDCHQKIHSGYFYKQIEEKMLKNI